MSEVQSPLWSYQEAADFLRISVPGVKKWQRERKIPFLKVGRRTFFLKPDLETFLVEKCRMEPKPLTTRFQDAKARLRSLKTSSDA